MRPMNRECTKSDFLEVELLILCTSECRRYRFAIASPPITTVRVTKKWIITLQKPNETICIVAGGEWKPRVAMRTNCFANVMADTIGTEEMNPNVRPWLSCNFDGTSVVVYTRINTTPPPPAASVSVGRKKSCGREMRP